MARGRMDILADISALLGRVRSDCCVSCEKSYDFIIQECVPVCHKCFTLSKLIVEMKTL